MNSFEYEIPEMCFHGSKDYSLGKKKADKILLTGATGFLGPFLLHELLEQTDAKIFCMVRPRKGCEPEQRLIDNMKKYFLWKDEFLDRIEIIIGDLTKPFLGLSNEQFDTLAGEVDSIYHNGANVNFIYSYEVLKTANVNGTEEVLSLAVEKKLKPFHYISTMNVLLMESLENGSLIVEDRMPNDENIIQGERMMPGLGYLRSKRAAEMLLEKAREKGVPINIYRLGRISGHSKTGACQTNDFFWRMVKASVKIGRWPDLNSRVNLTPVDYTSKSIVYIAEYSNVIGKNFHVFNTNPFVFSMIAQYLVEQGYPMKLCSNDEWTSALVQKEYRNSERAIQNASSSHTSPQFEVEGDFGGLSFDDSNIRAALSGSGITCPLPDKQLFDTYINYFKSIGYFNT